MSLATIYSDQILERCRAFLIDPDADADIVKGACEDVILSVCAKLVTHYGSLLDQHAGYSVRNNKLMRELRTNWRAIVKRVTTAQRNIVINERQLFAVACTLIHRRILEHPRVLVADIYEDDTRALMNCKAADRRRVIREVLSHYRK